MATIKIRCQPHYTIGWKKFNIIVDGKKVGAVGRKAEESFEVAIGPHTVVATMGASLWALNSKTVEIDLASSAMV